MARNTEPSVAALTQAVRLAHLAVSAAIPLPFDPAGVVEASPHEDHLMELRALAFPAVLEELLDGEYTISKRTLDALEQGHLPPLEN